MPSSASVITVALTERGGRLERLTAPFLGARKAIVGSCNVYGLLRAATAIGEASEAVRTRDFLFDLDPTNHFELRRD